MLLMIAGHSMVLYQQFHGPQDWIWWTRHTVTRLSMPLFMMVAGLLIAKRGSPAMNRVIPLTMAAIVTNVPFYYLPELGFYGPNILINFLMALPFYWLFTRHPIETVMLGVLQTLFMPITWNEWYGYQPGIIMAFLGLGALLKHHPDSLVLRIGRRLPQWLAFFGRRPLLWFVGHLTLIFFVGVYFLYN